MEGRPSKATRSANKPTNRAAKQRKRVAGIAAVKRRKRESAPIAQRGRPSFVKVPIPTSESKDCCSSMKDANGSTGLNALTVLITALASGAKFLTLPVAPHAT